MDRKSARAPGRPIPAAATGAALTIVLVAIAASGVVAQTLTAPDAGTTRPPPQSAHSQPARPAKSCSAFGAGFVNVPGTDACVKLGGSVTVEGTRR